MLPEQKKDTVQGCLLEASHKLFQKTFEQVSKLETHPGQLPILRLLKHSGGLSQREIAEILKIKPPTVNVSIHRMEKSGYVTRRPDEKDQRVSRVYLTEKGSRLEAQVHEIMGKIEENLIQNFTESELCLLKRMLIHLIDNLEKM